jgi:predicted RNase H-like HicB family nuclease
VPKKYYRVELTGGTEIQVFFETTNGWVINFVVKLIILFEGGHYEVVRYDTAHGCPHKDVLDIDGNVKRKVWFELYLITPASLSDKDEGMKMKLTEEVWKEGSMYVSYCPELDVASCGETVDQARRSLREAILINLEETRKMGTFDRFLDEAGLHEEQDDILSAGKELVGFRPFEIAV